MVCSSLSICVCILLLNLWLNAQEASTLTIQDFFPYGIEHNDTALAQEDDLVESISLPTEFPFFGKMYSTVGVSTEPIIINHIIHVCMLINNDMYVNSNNESCSFTRYQQMGYCHSIRQ